MASTNSYRLRAPDGSWVEIPVGVESDDPYEALADEHSIEEYYNENGYVVVRGLIPEELCVAVKKEFDEEVKNFDGYLYRQATANPERHEFNQDGYMMNSILNIQDLNSRRFPKFKAASLDVLCHRAISGFLPAIVGARGKLVQSMFFEGNSETWAHQDTYYLDAETLGKMTGAWIAVEDIRPEAGRFFVYPGSHKIDIRKNGGDFNIAFNHDKYKKLVIDIIKNEGLTLHAPALRRGDVLFWSSKTIHGSLATTARLCSRSSLTAHYIPQNERFLQHQSRIKRMRIREQNEMLVHYPKSQDKLLNQWVLFFESRFPNLFQFVKKIVIRLLA